jgi:hypothetical protein
MGNAKSSNYGLRARCLLNLWVAEISALRDATTAAAPEVRYPPFPLHRVALRQFERNDALMVCDQLDVEPRHGESRCQHVATL